MYEKKKNIPRLLFYFIVLMFLLQAYNNSFKAKKKIQILIYSDMILKKTWIYSIMFWICYPNVNKMCIGNAGA